MRVELFKEMLAIAERENAKYVPNRPGDAYCLLAGWFSVLISDEDAERSLAARNKYHDAS